MQGCLNIIILNVINSFKRLKEINIISVDTEKGSNKI